VFNLPPYCPELNSTERIWHDTRMEAANFGPTRPVISEERDHLFRTIASSCFGLIATIFS
jgi:hypothetical protein